MNLGITILAIVLILFAVFWRWYKLKDAGEGDHDLINMGFGTHVERWAFEARIILVLIICFFVLLAALTSP